MTAALQRMYRASYILGKTRGLSFDDSIPANDLEFIKLVDDNKDVSELRMIQEWRRGYATGSLVRSFGQKENVK